MPAPLAGRWSMAHACCVACGTTERPHHSHGYCRPCAARHAPSSPFRERHGISQRQYYKTAPLRQNGALDDLHSQRGAQL